MNLFGNIIWLIFGGLFAAIGYFIGGLLLCLTIIGIPWGIQCFKLAGLVLWPFGKNVISESSSAGCLSVLCNMIWILCGGWYTAVIHIFMGIILFITIIGIPWGRQHFKLVEISLMPFGKRIVEE
ncbi:MAG TPA: YccF domain-containing protein [Chitinophagaceae bacterium]